MISRKPTCRLQLRRSKTQPWSTALAATFSPRFHHLLTTFLPVGFPLCCHPIAKDPTDKPKLDQEQPEAHHNSPQTPEDTFYSQQNGPSTAIDFWSLQKRPKAVV